MADIRKKKILMTLMRLEIGGAETHVLELSLELARQGFDVCVASGGGVYEKALQEAGITHYTVPMYTKSPAKVLQSIKLLKKIIKDEKIDIVHAHGRIPAFLCGLLHLFMRFTFVTTAHWVFRTDCGLKYISNWGEKVMAVSEDIKTYLIENYGTNPQNIFVTINGIDTNKFSQKTDFSGVLDEFSLLSDSRKIVYISRMDEDRALVAFQLAEIAPAIDEAFPGTEIVIVGGGNFFDQLKELTERINGQIGRKMITLTGARTDIDRFAAMSDLFIGVSRSALEAMSCAKPVIVAGNEGYLGIFEEDKLQAGIDTNFCCRGLSMSTKELLFADVKKILSASDAQRKAWGMYARQVILDRYSVSKMAADNAEMYAKAVDTKPFDAVISGYYGFGNSGDEALLSAMLRDIREKIPTARICVLSQQPKKTAALYGVSSVYRYRYLKIKKLMKHAKLFISGGGSLLQDVTSSRSLRYYLSLIQMAKRVGTQVMIYANGIGPVIKPKNRLAVWKTLQDVETITLRESASLSELESLGLSTDRVVLTADPALSIAPSSAEQIDALLTSEGIFEGEKLFGISVRPWKLADTDFEQKLADVITEICQQRKLLPVFIPMKYPEDFAFSNQIAARMPIKSYILSTPRSAPDLIGLIGRMEIILAERLHSLIYAANASTPTVGLSYDTKVDAFMAYVGIGTTVSVEQFSPQLAKEAVFSILDRRETVKEALIKEKTVLSEKARQNADIACSVIKKSVYGMEEQ